MKTDVRHVVIVITAAFVLYGCAGIYIGRPLKPSPEDWTTLGGDAGRTSRTSVAAIPPMEQIWQYNALSGLAGSPLVRDSVIVIGTLQGEIQAVNMTNGKRIGYVVMDSPIAGTPVLDGGNVIIPLASGIQTLVSYDLIAQKRLWSMAYGPIESSPLLLDQYVYVTTLDGILYCIGKSDGLEIWKFKTQLKEERKPIRSSPATDGHRIFFGGDDWNIYAVDAKQGELKWTFKTHSSVFASPVVVADRIIAGSLDGTVYCLDAAAGTLLWKYEARSKIYGSASTDGSLVFVGSADGVCHALDIRSGALHWKYSTQSVIDCAPLIAGDFLYVGSLDRMLYVLRAQSGEEVWRYTAQGRIHVTPVVWRNVLLVTSEDKYITALRPRTSQ